MHSTTGFAALLLLVAATAAQAQEAPQRFTLEGRGGFNVPTFDISDAVDGGPSVGVGLGYQLSPRLWLMGDLDGAEAFGPVFSIAALAFIFGSMTARQSVRRLNRRWLLLAGALVAAAAGSGLGAISVAHPPMALLWLLLCFYIFCFGLLVPMSTAMALEPAGANAGLASSIIGTVQILAGALSSTVAASGLLGDSYVSLCLIMAASAILAFVLALSSFRSVGRRS